MDIDPNKAVDFLLANAPRYAKAKAERIYIEQYRKSLKAILFTESDSKTVADREAEEVLFWQNFAPLRDCHGNGFHVIPLGVTVRTSRHALLGSAPGGLTSAPRMVLSFLGSNPEWVHC